MDPVSAAGLASSIIAFLDVAYKIGKRAREFSKTAGALPSDIATVKELLDIVVGSAERIHARHTTSSGAICGPPTENEVGLAALFKKLGSVTGELLDIVSSLDRAGNSVAKALVSIRKDKKLERVKSDMHNCIVSIELLLLEGLRPSTDDTIDVATDMRNALLQYHQRIEAKMSAGFQTLTDRVDGSQDNILRALGTLMSDQKDTCESGYIDLRTGQQEIERSLSKLPNLLATTHSRAEGSLAARLERLFEEQRSTLQAFAMIQDTRQSGDDAMSAQVMALARQMSHLTAASRSAIPTNAEDLVQGTGKRERGSLRHNAKDGIYLRVEFEFDYHRSVVSIHIHHCIQWASTRVFPSLSLSKSEWTVCTHEWTVCIPTLFRDDESCGCRRRRQRAKMTLEVIFVSQEGNYRRLPIDLADEKYDGDLVEALRVEYDAYRDPIWFKLPSYIIAALCYLLYLYYADKLVCFLGVDLENTLSRVKLGLGALDGILKWLLSNLIKGIRRDVSYGIGLGVLEWIRRKVYPKMLLGSLPVAESIDTARKAGDLELLQALAHIKDYDQAESCHPKGDEAMLKALPSIHPIFIWALCLLLMSILYPLMRKEDIGLKTFFFLIFMMVLSLGAMSSLKARKSREMALPNCPKGAHTVIFRWHTTGFQFPWISKNFRRSAAEARHL